MCVPDFAVVKVTTVKYHEIPWNTMNSGFQYQCCHKNFIYRKLGLKSNDIYIGKNSAGAV